MRAAVAALLAARGAPLEAAVVERAELHLLPGSRQWSLGSREVEAHSFELSLEARDFADLTASNGGRERVKDALSDAVATGQTILADLFVVLRLPEVGGGWSHAYRSAPRRDWEPPTDADSVLAAAVALLDAEGHVGPARLLERGRLAFAEVTSSEDSPLRRWVAFFAPRDLAEIHRGATASENIRRAIALAATRAREVVASVELAVVGVCP